MTQWSNIFVLWLRRELHVRYHASMIGIGWLILQPALQILLFTLVFYQFFKIRWPQGSGSIQEYGLQVFVGLALYTFFAETLNRSPTTILSQSYLVTKVKFPLTVLPSVVVGAAGIQMFLSLAIILLAGAGLITGWAWLAIPLLLLPLFIDMLAIAIGVSALSVYLKDLSHLAPSLSSFMLFLSPVFYPASMIPASFQWLITYNPLAWSIEATRAALFHDAWPAAGAWAGHLLAAMLGAALALAFFRRVEKGFPDAL